MAADNTVASDTQATSTLGAVSQDGVLDPGELALFYNSNTQGSFSDFYWSIPDLAGFTFLSPGAGQGFGVKNEAASAYNNRGYLARVWYNSYYQGLSDTVAAYSGRNLLNTYNQNASFSWM